MLPLSDVVTVEAWRLRSAAVLAELPDDLADYKGITPYRKRAVDWLRSRPAGATTFPDVYPGSSGRGLRLDTMEG